MRSMLNPLAAMLLFLALGCAQEPVKRQPIFNAREDERWIQMEERLSRQETQIQRLAAALEASRANAASAPAPVAPKKKEAPKLPVKKLVPGTETDWEEVPAEEASNASDGDTVVDSSHEVMQHYFRGLQLMEQGKPEKAVPSFQTFLRESPDHVYADRADYWVMEAYFRNKEYQLAVVSANRFEVKYPRSFRMPDVLLKRALAQVGLGQNGDARASLRDLVKKYPANPIADTASRKLTELALRKKPPMMPSAN